MSSRLKTFSLWKICYKKEKTATDREKIFATIYGKQQVSWMNSQNSVVKNHLIQLENKQKVWRYTEENMEIVNK